MVPFSSLIRNCHQLQNVDMCGQVLYINMITSISINIKQIFIYVLNLN